MPKGQKPADRLGLLKLFESGPLRLLALVLLVGEATLAVLAVRASGVAQCTIRVIGGRIEQYPRAGNVAIVLPCDEYFDDDCFRDPRSSLGAYVGSVFAGKIDELVLLVRQECMNRLGAGSNQRKTEDKCAISFGAGKCVLLRAPFGVSTPVAFVSTTTQRAGQGLFGRISYLFDAMRELCVRLADARIGEVAMPVLAAGHAGIDPPLALVGLLLAVAEAARYGQGAQRLRAVTIVVFQADPESPWAVNQAVVRRALALVGSRE